VRDVEPFSQRVLRLAVPLQICSVTP
jgi:hypothetical protein